MWTAPLNGVKLWGGGGRKLQRFLFALEKRTKQSSCAGVPYKIGKYRTVTERASDIANRTCDNSCVTNGQCMHMHTLSENRWPAIYVRIFIII